MRRSQCHRTTVTHSCEHPAVEVLIYLAGVPCAGEAPAMKAYRGGEARGIKMLVMDGYPDTIPAWISDYHMNAVHAAMWISMSVSVLDMIDASM